MPFFKPLNEEMVLPRPFYLFSKAFPVMYGNGTPVKNLDELLTNTYPDSAAQIILESFERNGVHWNRYEGNRPVIWPNQVLAYRTGCCLDFAYFMHRVFDYHDIEHALCFVTFMPTIRGYTGQPIDGHVFPMFIYEGKVFIWNYFGYDEEKRVAFYDINGPFVSYKDAAVQSAPYFSVLYQTNMKPYTVATIPRTSCSCYIDGRFLIGIDDACDRNEAFDQDEFKNRIRRLERYIQPGAEFNPVTESVNLDILPSHFGKPSIKGIKEFMKLMKSKSILRKGVGNADKIHRNTIKSLLNRKK